MLFVCRRRVLLVLAENPACYITNYLKILKNWEMLKIFSPATPADLQENFKCCIVALLKKFSQLPSVYVRDSCLKPMQIKKFPSTWSKRFFNIVFDVTISHHQEVSQMKIMFLIHKPQQSYITKKMKSTIYFNFWPS